jgi:periplasmic nitrate reductase NapE
MVPRSAGTTQARRIAVPRLAEWARTRVGADKPQAPGRLLEKPGGFGDRVRDNRRNECCELRRIACGSTTPLDESEDARRQARREGWLFLLLAVVIWPFIAVAFVGTFGFIVWIYQMLTGPPGPV